MPDTIVMPFWRNKADVSAHSPGESRSGSSASWTRRMPVLSNLAAKSAGLAGCNDQLHTANRSLRELFFMLMTHYRPQTTDHGPQTTEYCSPTPALKTGPPSL